MADKTWNDYYAKNTRVNLSNILLHWKYLFSIVRTQPKNVLEIGCGPADHSVTLSQFFPSLNISVLDNDKDIIKKLKEKFTGRFQKFYLCDILSAKEVKKQKWKKDQFDVIYSQGLLEHFDEKDSEILIKNFIPYTPRLIFSIPSHMYPTRDFGNEILRDKKELVALLKPIKGIHYSVISYFPDIGIRTKLYTIKMKNMTIGQAIWFLLFGSCHYLVEVNRED